MTIEQATTEYLASELEPQSVHFLKAPTDAPLPRVVLTLISPSRQFDTDVRRVRLQVSVWHDDRYAAITLRESVYDALQRFRGYMGDVRVTAVAFDTGQVLWDDGVKAYHMPTDFMVTYIGDDQ